MSKLILRGAFIREYTSYVAAGGQRTIDVKLTANWTKPVCELLDWEEAPKGFGKASMEGSLHGVNMIMEPSDSALKDYQFDIPIGTVGSFKHVPVLDGEGRIGRRELHFEVTTVADDAALVLDNWQKHIGEATAQCRITYNAEQQQELLDPEKEAEPEKTRGRRKAQEAVQ